MSDLENKFIIEKAKREAAPVTAAFISQSGGGKTYSALLFARGLVGAEGKIVVIDTEGGRAKLYADDPEIGGFEHMNFELPYSSSRYKDAVMTAVLADADAIIIDSASHEHEAEGGMLDFAEKEEVRLRKVGTGKGAHISKWIKPKMSHNRFVRSAVGSPCHVIFCIREKLLADMSDEAKYKKPEDKVMTVPVCDKNLIFEMTIAIRLEPDTHKATFIKVPKPFEAHIKNGEVITVEHGRNLLKVAMTGDEFNKEVEKQKTICKDIASYGVKKLRLHWQTLSEELRKSLQSELESVYKPIAEQSDADTKAFVDALEEGEGDE